MALDALGLGSLSSGPYDPIYASLRSLWPLGPAAEGVWAQRSLWGRVMGSCGRDHVRSTCSAGFEDDPAHQGVPHRLLDPLLPRKWTLEHPIAHSPPEPEI
jgi:hypothetical protein